MSRTRNPSVSFLKKPITSVNGAVAVPSSGSSEDEILIIEDLGPKRKFSSQSVSQNLSAAYPVDIQSLLESASGKKTQVAVSTDVTGSIEAGSTIVNPVPGPAPKRFKAASKPIRVNTRNQRGHPQQQKSEVKLEIKNSFKKTVDTLGDFRSCLKDLKTTLEKDGDRRMEELDFLKENGEIDLEDYKYEVGQVNLSKSKLFFLFLSFSSSMQLMKEGLSILTDEAVSTLRRTG